MRDDDPLFLLSNQQSLYNYWKFYQRCNGIDPPVSLYELRHTFVSMIEDAVPPAQLRRIVGHSKSMDTYGWYSHAVTGPAMTPPRRPSPACCPSTRRAPKITHFATTFNVRAVPVVHRASVPCPKIGLNAAFSDTEGTDRPKK